MVQSSAIVPGRAVLRGLNLLLKSVRLYGFDHQLASAQMDDVWAQLQGMWSGGDRADFTIGVVGSELLLNGTRVEPSPTEQSLVRLMASAGLNSMQISPKVTREEFAHFVRIFAEGSAKPAGLIEQLRAALAAAGTSSIGINEIEFVAKKPGAVEPEASPALPPEMSLASQLAVSSMPTDATQVQNWFNDPIKLLEAIAAAEGAQQAPGGTGAGPGPAGVGGGQAGVGGGQAGAGGGQVGVGGGQAGTGGAAGPELQPGSGTSLLGGAGTVQAEPPLQEEELQRLLRMLSNLGGTAGEAHSGHIAFEEQLRGLSVPAQTTLRQALLGIAAATPRLQPEGPLLLRLAEHLAIRFALERYQRGEVRTDAVHQMLERMAGQIGALRKVLRAQEEQLSKAGLPTEPAAEILDREFWAAVPATGKRMVLLSPEAWCIPPRNVRQFVEELEQEGDKETAAAILRNYAACARSAEVEARRKTASGLVELAEVYCRGDGELFASALSAVGDQMRQEREPELQGLLGGAFVRLSQEAASRGQLRDMKQSLELLQAIEKDRPAWVQRLRLRLGIEKQIPELIEEALRAPEFPDGLVDLLGALPVLAADQLAARMIRCVRRRERERLVALARELGSSCPARLREVLRARPVSEGLSVIGLLSRLDAKALAELLPNCLRGGGRAIHDAVLRQLATGGAPERGRLLLDALDRFDRLVLPQVIEELGTCGDPEAVARLIGLVEGKPPAANRTYLRLKALEALGQTKDAAAEPLLRSMAEARNFMGWTHPKEVRIVAAQALAKMDVAWARDFLPRSGLEDAELLLGPLDPAPDAASVRHRYYLRVRPPHDLGGVIATEDGKHSVMIKVLSLGGGFATCSQPLSLVTEAELKIHSGLRPITATIFARMVGAQQLVFQFVEMDLEERLKLRRLLSGLVPTPKPPKGG